MLGIFAAAGILTIITVLLGLLFNPDVFYVLILVPIAVLIGLAHLLIFTVKVHDKKIEIKLFFSKYSYDLKDLKEIFVCHQDIVLSFYGKPDLIQYQSVHTYLNECKKRPMICVHNLLADDDLFRSILPSYKGKIILKTFSNENYKTKLISLGVNKEMF